MGDELSYEQELQSRGRAKWGDCYMSWPSDWRRQVGGPARPCTEKEKEEFMRRANEMDRNRHRRTSSPHANGDSTGPGRHYC